MLITVHHRPPVHGKKVHGKKRLRKNRPQVEKCPQIFGPWGKKGPQSKHSQTYRMNEWMNAYLFGKNSRTVQGIEHKAHKGHKC